MKHDYETCSAIAANFKKRIDFKNGADAQYQWLRRNGKLDAACAHMKPVRRSLSDTDIAAIAKNYSGRRAFKLGDQGAYQMATKRGILDTVCDHMDNQRYRILTDEQLAEKAQQFQSRSAFDAGDSGAYQAATKRCILDAICAHMPKGTRRLSNVQILEIAGRYKTRNDFKLGDFGAYTTAIRRGLITEASEHMQYGYTGFREDLPATLYQFKIITPCGMVLYKVGITNRTPKQRLITMGLVKGCKTTLIGSIYFALGRDARMTEKRLHRRFRPYRYSGPLVMKNGNTEIFTVNPMSSTSTN